MRTLDPGRTVVSLTFNPDGRTLAAGYYGGVGVWDVAAGSEQFLPTDPGRYCFGVCVGPAGDRLAWLDGHTHRAAETDPLAAVGRAVRGRRHGFDDAVPHGFQPDGRLLALLPTGVRSLDPFTGRRKRPLGDQPARHLAVCPAGGWLAVLADPALLFRWEAGGWAAAGPLPHPRRAYTRVGFAGPGRVWLAESDGRLTTFDAAVGEVLADRAAIPGGLLAVAPDGRQALARLDYRELALVDLDSGRPVRTFDWGVGMLDACAVAPDGLTAAVAGPGGRIALFDLD